ncbi:nickel-dependent lactate racemase [Petroclostridium xylanilyticum]|jgi:nickel-dependent lactate racemase|uniref:nickel-dependent lactate racemase n=1 Tax=Petroclostridium xylanilyticum TaxID=1792311 RepID=UPI000B97DFF2|nr:nickel-dependent lactate racemase [Petroclostridium xylanilyticum]
MFVNFYYPEIKGVEIPDENFCGVFKPKLTENTTDVENLVREALQKPIGCNKLSERLKPSDKILIISDDNTRNTPVDKILNVLLPYLQELGIKKDNITILMALGTHRPMNHSELVGKLGQQIVDEYKVVNHLWDKKEENMYYGKTSRGIEVWGNKLLYESDFVIGLGHIVPHRVAGFSGGGKIVQPGVSNGQSTGETHWLSALVSGSEIMGKRDNLVREQIDEAARLMGLDFIINVVQDLKENVVDIFAGDLAAAHRAGCDLAKEVYGVKIPKADIVITDSYPADIELWQAAKGIYSSELVVKDGGYVILVTPCPEGVAKTHPEIERFGYVSLEEAKELMEKKQLEEKSVAAHLVHVGRVIKEKAHGILVCPNISNEIKEKLGFIPSNSVQEALSYALSKIGKYASVVVMLHAGEILPLD